MSYSKDYIITTQSSSINQVESFTDYFFKGGVPVPRIGRIRQPGGAGLFGVPHSTSAGGAPYTTVAGIPSTEVFPLGNICYNGSWGPGKIGNYSLKFDGSNSYVTAGDTSDFAWMHGKHNPTGFKWTFSCWCKLNAKPADTDALMVLFSTNDATSGAGVTIAMDDSGAPGTQAILLLIYNSSNQAKAAVNFNYKWANDVGWHHLVISYDEGASAGALDDYIMAYFDGAHLSMNYGKNSPAGTLDTDSLRTPTIGDTGGGAGDKKWDGLIDDVAIWNVRLEQESVTKLYNGKGGVNSIGRPAHSISASNIVAYWNMEDGPGSSTVKNYPGAISGTVAGSLNGMSAGEACFNPPKKPW